MKKTLSYNQRDTVHFTFFLSLPQYFYSAGNGQGPNAPNFCLGPPEITKLWTIVAQIHLFANSK